MALHRNHAAENISIKACDETGKLFLFVSPLGEKHLGAAGISRPVVGCDSALIDKMNSLLSTNFPIGTVIQFVQFASPDVDEIINVYESGKQNSAEILSHLSHEHAEMYRNAKFSPLVQASGVKANHKRLFFGIKFPVNSVDPSPNEIKEVLAAIDAAFDGLSAAQIRMDRIDEKTYRQFVHAMHNPWAKEKDSVSVQDEMATLNEQILPVGLDINYNYNKDRSTISFNQGEYFARILSVNFLPHKVYPWVMNDVIGDWTGISNQVTDPYFLSLTLTYPDQEKTKQALMVRAAQINNQAGSTIVKFLPEVGERHRGINAMVAELRSSPVMVKMTWNMIVYSREERQLERLTNSLVAYYSTLGRGEKKFDIKVDKRILRALFEQAIPLNATAKGLHGTFRTKTVGARHAAALLPLYGDLTFAPSPYGSLSVTRRGEPAIIDPFDSNTNYNGLITAESGAGKSVQVQSLILDHLASGGRCWAIDDGRSMEKMCRILGGQFISFSKNSEICLNPFSTIQPGKLDEEMDLLKTMFMKMAAPRDGLTDNQMAKLERAISQSYQNYAHTATVRTVADFLLQQDDPESRRIGEQLFPFASGQFSRWFDGEANINFNSKFVVLEMGDLKQLPHLKDVVALQLFALITRGMREITDDSRKMLVIEEAKQWLLDPIMAKGIEEAYARARKDKGAAIAVTQSLTDITESPSGMSIMQNAAWLMMLKQKPASIKRAIEGNFLQLDPYGAKLLESVTTVRGAYAEFMFMREGAYGIYRSIFTRFQQVMLSTTGAERTEILQAIDNGVSAQEAITAFVAREQNHQANADNYRMSA